MTETLSRTRWVRAARIEEVQATECKVVHLNGQSVALFASGGSYAAIDNRCPHMGFPLHRGTVRDGILTCHWHHARFDLCGGGALDLWADDVRRFPTEIRDDELWVDLGPRPDLRAYYHRRIRDGLENGISLLLAKSAVFLNDVGEDPAEAFRVGLDYGVRYRTQGWSQGLTMHTCFANLLPYLDPEDRPRAVFHGLRAVGVDSGGARFVIEPLPNAPGDIATLKRWFRHCVEVRDDEGAERCLVSAIRGGASQHEVADMLFAAATDHRYLTVGHVVDFTNKAFEALDVAGWDHAEPVLSSLVRGYAHATRMEESKEWRQPVDVVEILHNAFDALAAALERGRERRGTWEEGEDVIPVLLGVDAQAIADALLKALSEGCTPEELGRVVAHAAALRIARFPLTNEFADWDTALHTFSFANAVHQGIRRAPSTELLRGVFDAAMSVYLDRFLNAPVAYVPEPDDTVDDPEDVLRSLPSLLDRQSQVTEAGESVGRYLNSGGDPDRMLALLGKLLLREDRDFHTIQTMEAAFRQYELLRGTATGMHVLVAATRYLAAHSPTVRAQGQTFQIAQRLHRGEKLYEDEEAV